MLSCADLDSAVAAGGAGEPLDGPAGAGLDEPGDGEGGEHDGQVGVDGLTFVVADRAGLQVVLDILNDFSRFGAAAITIAAPLTP